MARKVVKIAVTTTGIAGVAVGSAIASIPGGVAELLGYDVKYTSQPGTVDVTLTAEQPNGVTKTLATLTSQNTDLAMRRPLEAGVDSVGADLADTTKSPNLVKPLVFGTLKVAVAQGDAATDAVIVTVVLNVL